MDGGMDGAVYTDAMKTVTSALFASNAGKYPDHVLF
jgi:hypothetical protein